MQYLWKTSQVLTLAPAVSTRPDETHSALIVSQESFQGSVRFEGSVCTLEQLRVGTANPWETAWLAMFTLTRANRLSDRFRVG